MDSDSVLCEKFQMIVMQYHDFLNQQIYYRRGPWK